MNIRGFVIAGILLTLFIGFILIFFTVFNDVFWNEDTGLEQAFNESVQDTFSDAGKDTWNSRMINLRFFYQMAGVTAIGTCFLFLIIWSFRTRRQDGGRDF